MKLLILMENYYRGGLDTFVINVLNHYPIHPSNLTLLINSSHPGLNQIVKNIGDEIRVETYTFRLSDILLDTRKSIFNRFKIIRGIKYYSFQILIRLFYFKRLKVLLNSKFKSLGCDELMIVNGGYPGSLLCQAAVYSWNRTFNKKPVYNFHNYANNKPSSSFEAKNDKYIINHVSCFVTVSNSCASSLRNRLGFSGADIRYIYNGIKDPTENYIEVDRLIKPRYCLILATYEARKGHKFAITVFEKVLHKFKDLQLHCFGYGRQHEIESLNKLIREKRLQNNIFLHSFSENKFNLIRNCEVLLVPSQSHESFGLTIIEAMAFGKPVVITDTGGIPEVVGQEMAELICNKNDSNGFANTIIRLVSDEAYYDNIADRCRKRFASSFKVENMVINYKKIMENE